MKNARPYIFGAFIAWFGYMTLSTAMYTYELSEFYGEEYSFLVHGIALNGRTGWGDKINVTDLSAIPPSAMGGTINEWCPEVTSKRGHLTMGYVGDEGDAVCCWVADENQWLVPYKDEGDKRHYLCGAWPHLDHVTQPISNSKLGIKSLTI